MTRHSISYGKCFLCGETVAKNAIGRHLRKCVPVHETGQGRPVRLFQIRAEGYHAPQYWLYLEIPASATLSDLDDFLRAVWLECCGHLSAFTIDDVRYDSDVTEEGGEEEYEEEGLATEEQIRALDLDPTLLHVAFMDDLFGPPPRSMAVPLEKVLSVGQTFIHEYDFGTTTTLRLKVVGEREGPQPQRGVRVLARNYAPTFTCIECGQPARWVNVWSSEYETYCDQHARKHKDWEGGFLPIVNSPRMGECGYTGPRSSLLQFEETMPEQGQPG